MPKCWSLAEVARALKAAGASGGEAHSILAVLPYESGGGRPRACDVTNPSSGACGPFQLHPPPPGCHNLQTSAGIALSKRRTQGIGAWSAKATPQSHKWAEQAVDAAYGEGVGEKTARLLGAESFGDLGLADIGGFFKTIAEPTTWIRVMLVGGGALLGLLGLLQFAAAPAARLITRQLAGPRALARAVK